MRFGCFQWSLSCYAEVCCVNSVRIHGFWWNGGLRWARNVGAIWIWKTSCLLSRLRGWELLFLSLFVTILHGVGSSCNRHRAHPLTTSVSNLVGPTDRLSSAAWVLGNSPFGFQLPLSIGPMTFRPNNHVMSIFRAMGFKWVSFGLVNSAKTNL